MWYKTAKTILIIILVIISVNASLIAPTSLIRQVSAQPNTRQSFNFHRSWLANAATDLQIDATDYSDILASKTWLDKLLIGNTATFVLYNTKYIPTNAGQQPTGGCMAWSSIYVAGSYVWNRKLHRIATFDNTFAPEVYFAFNDRDGTGRAMEGSYPQHLAKAIDDMGLIPSDLVPITAYNQMTDMYTYQPDRKELLVGDKPYPVEVKLYMRENNDENLLPYIKAAASKHYGVVIFIDTAIEKDKWQSWWNLPSSRRTPITATSPLNMADMKKPHAIAVMGYDDQQKVVFLKNTWGGNSGINGIVPVTYDYIKNIAAGILIMIPKQVSGFVPDINIYNYQIAIQTYGAYTGTITISLSNNVNILDDEHFIVHTATTITATTLSVHTASKIVIAQLFPDNADMLYHYKYIIISDGKQQYLTYVDTSMLPMHATWLEGFSIMSSSTIVKTSTNVTTSSNNTSTTSSTTTSNTTPILGSGGRWVMRYMDSGFQNMRHHNTTLLQKTSLHYNQQYFYPANYIPIDKHFFLIANFDKDNSSRTYSLYYRTSTDKIYKVWDEITDIDKIIANDDYIVFPVERSAFIVLNKHTLAPQTVPLRLSNVVTGYYVDFFIGNKLIFYPTIHSDSDNYQLPTYIIDLQTGWYHTIDDAVLSNLQQYLDIHSVKFSGINIDTNTLHVMYAASDNNSSTLYRRGNNYLVYTAIQLPTTDSILENLSFVNHYTWPSAEVHLLQNIKVPDNHDFDWGQLIFNSANTPYPIFEDEKYLYWKHWIIPKTVSSLNEALFAYTYYDNKMKPIMALDTDDSYDTTKFNTSHYTPVIIGYQNNNIYFVLAEKDDYYSTAIRNQKAIAGYVIVSTAQVDNGLSKEYLNWGEHRILLPVNTWKNMPKLWYNSDWYVDISTEKIHIFYSPVNDFEIHYIPEFTASDIALYLWDSALTDIHILDNRPNVLISTSQNTPQDINKDRTNYVRPYSYVDIRSYLATKTLYSIQKLTNSSTITHVYLSYYSYNSRLIITTATTIYNIDYSLNPIAHTATSVQFDISTHTRTLLLKTATSVNVVSITYYSPATAFEYAAYDGYKAGIESQIVDKYAIQSTSTDCLQYQKAFVNITPIDVFVSDIVAYATTHYHLLHNVQSETLTGFINYLHTYYNTFNTIWQKTATYPLTIPSAYTVHIYNHVYIWYPISQFTVVSAIVDPQTIPPNRCASTEYDSSRQVVFNGYAVYYYHNDIHLLTIAATHWPNNFFNGQLSNGLSFSSYDNKYTLTDINLHTATYRMYTHQELANTSITITNNQKLYIYEPLDMILYVFSWNNNPHIMILASVETTNDQQNTWLHHTSWAMFNLHTGKYELWNTDIAGYLYQYLSNPAQYHVYIAPLLSFLGERYVLLAQKDFNTYGVYNGAYLYNPHLPTGIMSIEAINAQYLPLATIFPTGNNNVPSAVFDYNLFAGTVRFCPIYNAHTKVIDNHLLLAGNGKYIDIDWNNLDVSITSPAWLQKSQYYQNIANKVGQLFNTYFIKEKR
ncbi:hypothetical protein GM182_07295 [bacterium 3DAC]|nr:hypothetical protein GM182_07295 [bacterium 3DAC]